MGACGCTSGQERVTFEGPDGYRYALIINPGCSNCGYGPYVGISRYETDPNDGEGYEGYFDDHPEIEFDEDSWWDPTTFYILNTDIKAREKVKEALLGQEIWPEDMDEEKMVKIDEHYAEDLASEVVMPAIRQAVRDTIHKTMERLYEDLREKDNEEKE